MKKKNPEGFDLAEQYKIIKKEAKRKKKTLYGESKLPFSECGSIL
jgi:hypothetical protein